MNVDSRFRRLRFSCCRSMLSAAVIALAIFLAGPIAGAQSTGGRIRGTVMDPSGGAVPAAAVQLINEATHATREVQSGANGEYIFLEMPVGSYEIDVTSQGFKKYTRKGVVLNLNEVVTLDITLQIGGSTEVVEVTGAPPVVDTTSTQLGAVVNERATTQLPLNQRDAYQLLQLQPGVQSQLGNDLFYGSDKAGVVTVNGGRGRSNNFSVNGGDGNDLFANLPAIQPSPDSIEEFRVITNSFDAEYGRNSGAVVNVVTKSGTNEWHGSAFEFFRNKVLNAKGFYDTVKPDLIQDQFGGTFGGPVKKDKTFFFGSYEGRRIKQGISSTPVIVPTADELKGNFSAIGSANLVTQFGGAVADRTVANILNNRCGTQINNLSSVGAAELTALANGSSTNSVPYPDIFPNLQIPIQCFDPVAVNLLSFVPGPNVAGTNIRQVVPNSTKGGDQFTIKVDHEFTRNQKTSVYYFLDDDNFLDPFAKFQAAGGNLGNFPGTFSTRTQQINASHTWTIGSTAVNEARFTWFREGQGTFDAPTHTNLVTNSCGSDPKAQPSCFTGTSDTPLVDANGNPIASNPKLGITPNLGASKEGVPFISVSGGFSMGNNFEGQLPQVGNTFQISDNFAKVVGKHSWKFGGDFRHQKFDQTLYFDVNGEYIFNSAPSGDSVGFADAYPSYLLGLPASYLQGSAQQELVRTQSVYLFAQDSWKLKPNVTLNYGLRWELNTPLADIGKKVQTFRPGQKTTIYPCQLSATSIAHFQSFGVTNPDCNNTGVFPTGLVVPGDAGIPNGLTATYYKAFAPRLGLNWSPAWKDGMLAKLTGGPSKTSISTGWGLFYNPIEQLVLEQFSAEPPFGGSSFFANTLFSTPFVAQNGTVNPNPFNGILNPPRGQAVDWSLFRPILLFGQFPKQLRPQYSAQYNLTIKRELPGNVLFQVGYVGSQGHRLLATYDINHGNPQSCLDLNTILGARTCTPFGADSKYTIPAGTVIPAGGFHLPYGLNGPTVLPAGYVVGANNGGLPITLVGLRRYSSPNCDPIAGTGCPQDGVPVFSNIFSQDTVSHSNYNSLQVLVEKRFSHGLQFQAAYTYSKSLDNASSFESALNPVNFNSSYGPSLFDARHRFVFSYVWQLPVPKMEGFKGKVFDGWQMSGIVTYQTGFPIRITSGADNELFSSVDFEAPGEPNLTAPFHTWDVRKHGGFVFDPTLFDNTPYDPSSGPKTDPTAVTIGTIGNAPRSICCVPPINNWDLGFVKDTPLGERLRMEFRAEIYNTWNHAQFYSVDGNVSDQGSTFGKALHVRDPRLFQFALKFVF